MMVVPNIFFWLNHIEIDTTTPTTVFIQIYHPFFQLIQTKILKCIQLPLPKHMYNKAKKDKTPEKDDLFFCDVFYFFFKLKNRTKRKCMWSVAQL